MELPEKDLNQKKVLEYIIRGYYLTLVLEEHKKEAENNLNKEENIKNFCPYCFQRTEIIEENPCT